jgi:divalent metal cation (Fe/Co/Zn/Cd) transporter
MGAVALEPRWAAAAPAAALAGVSVDTWLGWWWSVPAAGLVIAALAATESVHLWMHSKPEHRPD